MTYTNTRISIARRGVQSGAGRHRSTQLPLTSARNSTVLPARVAADGSELGPPSPGAFESTLNIGPISQALNEQATNSASIPESQGGRWPVGEIDSFNYTPSQSRTQSSLNALARQMKATDPATGAPMEQLFESADVIGAIRGVMRRQELEQANVAHAYALYRVIFWGLAKSRTFLLFWETNNAF